MQLLAALPGRRAVVVSDATFTVEQVRYAFDADQLPAPCDPPMLVLFWRVGPFDSGRQWSVTVRLMDPDGRQRVAAVASVAVEPNPEVDTYLVQEIGIDHVLLESYGDHAFLIALEDREVGQVPLVVLRPGAMSHWLHQRS